MSSVAIITPPPSIFLILIALLSLCYLTPAHATAMGRYETNIKCIPQEREALLKFKEAIKADRCGLLATWRDEQGKRDCCEWTGVRCSNRTGHIVELDLRNREVDLDDLRCLTGNLGPSLTQLKHLKYLDLSYNDFQSQPIPSVIGSLTKLKYLNLSGAGFWGVIPSQLGNLTSLVALDLNGAVSDVENLWWLSPLTSLRYLDLSFANLSKANGDWFDTINKLSSLTDLRMTDCSLSPAMPSSLSYINSTITLRTLQLFGNDFGNSVFEWLFNLSGIYTHLVYVDLSGNQLKGPIPDKFSNLKNLTYLHLSWNNLQGRLPENLGNLCSLQELSLRSSNLTEELARVVQKLSRCAHLQLQHLDLRSNSIWGSLSGSGIFNKFSMLRCLDLSGNRLNGLSKLEYLHLSYNSLGGEVSSRHFAGLSRLRVLDLRSNNGLVVNLGSNWLPPFQLDGLYLGSCIMGPQFPTWLLTQTNFSVLDISNSSISDTIPASFWSSLQPELQYLDMSHNNISGSLPDFPISFTSFAEMDLSSNAFEGAAPLFHGAVGRLDLSHNMLQYALPLLCPPPARSTNVSYIDLSNNLLSGELPNDCWRHLNQLKFLSLENNKLSGKLPSLYGLQSLQSLYLRNNSFSGELPSLNSARSLTFLDLEHNSLSGRISLETENKFPPSLTVLTLKGNNFHGRIPQSLCELSSLRILDLSSNNLTGTIPECMNSLVGMIGSSNGSSAAQAYQEITLIYKCGVGCLGVHTDTASLTWKGTEESHVSFLRKRNMFDISSNALEGDIPETISFLTGLVSLNLSGNNLSGRIPEKIGQLTALESLDLSSNRLSGEIPESLSGVSFLEVLNLSDNNLSGRIPSGTQLQGFDPSAYMGNPELCGKPLDRKCPGDQSPDSSVTETSFVEKDDDGEDGYIFPGLYISIILGFITGFWAVCGTLVLKRSWREAYFRCLEDAKDRIYVAIAVDLWKKFNN